MSGAKLIIEVTAGIVIEEAMPEHTRHWTITSDEWEAHGDGVELLAERNGMASAYASLLMLQPDVVNWVRLWWVWL